MKYWSLREEIYRSLHQWPAMVMFFLIGCALGWGVSFLLPPTYRASSQIYVGLNPYRAYSDSLFLALARPKYTNIDDYKNWQMSELESVIFLDQILENTLEELRREDSHWLPADIGTLQGMLEAEWRSAGTWSLVAESPEETYATQAVEAWRQVTLTFVLDAVQSAQEMIMVDEELQLTLKDQLETRSRWEKLTQTKSDLETWMESAQASDKDQPLNPVERWVVLSMVTNAADFSQEWHSILKMQPEVDDPEQAYIDWATMILNTIESEVSSLENHGEILEGKREALEAQYTALSKESKGLSPNLVIEGFDNAATKRLRPTGVTTLLGGLIGLLGWILFQLVRITRRFQEE